MMVSAAWGGLIPGMVVIATHVRMVTCLRCGATLAISSRGIVMARLSGITCSMMVFATAAIAMMRSEEHTSELQSLMRISYAVFCLKKKNNKTNSHKSLKYKQKVHYSNHIILFNNSYTS